MAIDGCYTARQRLFAHQTLAYKRKLIAFSTFRVRFKFIQFSCSEEMFDVDQTEGTITIVYWFCSCKQLQKPVTSRECFKDCKSKICVLSDWSDWSECPRDTCVDGKVHCFLTLSHLFLWSVQNPKQESENIFHTASSSPPLFLTFIPREWDKLLVCLS